MAHQLDAEAGDAFESDMDSAAAAIDALDLADDHTREDEPVDAGDEDHGDGEDQDLDLTDDEDDGSDEPQQAAIEAPASLNAEEKAKFAQLPAEAQRYVADLEGRRATQVQQATTKAAEAQRTAEMRAAQADAQAKAVYANQLKAFADRLAPQRPDPALANTDPAAYIALNAQYDAAKAQHDDFVQQVTALSEDAQTSLTQAEITARDEALMRIPEVSNPETRDAFFKRAISTAETLGLDMNHIGNATAAEFKALWDIAGWKEKAEKYDSAMARQMQRVREGKKVQAAKPNSAQRGGNEGRGFRDARDRLRKTGDVRDAAAAIARLG